MDDAPYWLDWLLLSDGFAAMATLIKQMLCKSLQ
jgi:hypothetical protein